MFELTRIECRDCDDVYSICDSAFDVAASSLSTMNCAADALAEREGAEKALEWSAGSKKIIDVDLARMLGEHGCTLTEPEIETRLQQEVETHFG